MGKSANNNKSVPLVIEQGRLNKMIEALTLFMTMQHMAKIAQAQSILDSSKDDAEIRRLTAENAKAKQYVVGNLRMTLVPNASLFMTLNSVDIYKYLLRSDLTDLVPKIKARHFKVDKTSKDDAVVVKQFAETSENLAKVMISAIRNTPWKNPEVAAVATTVVAFATVIITGFVTPSFYKSLYSALGNQSPVGFSITLAMIAVAGILIFASSFAVLSHQNRKTAHLKVANNIIENVQAGVEKAYVLKLEEVKKQVNTLKPEAKDKIIFEDDVETIILTTDDDKVQHKNEFKAKAVTTTAVVKETEMESLVTVPLSPVSITKEIITTTTATADMNAVATPVLEAPIVEKNSSKENVTTSTTTTTSAAVSSSSSMKQKAHEVKQNAGLKYNNMKDVVKGKMNAVTASRTTNTAATTTPVSVPVTTVAATSSTTTTSSAALHQRFPSFTMPKLKVPAMSDLLNRHQQIEDEDLEMKDNNANAVSVDVTTNHATHVIIDIKNVGEMKRSASASSGLNLLDSNEKEMVTIQLNDNASDTSGADLKQGGSNTNYMLQLSGTLNKAKNGFKKLLNRNLDSNVSSSSTDKKMVTVQLNDNASDTSDSDLKQGGSNTNYMLQLSGTLNKVKNGFKNLLNRNSNSNVSSSSTDKNNEKIKLLG